MATITEREDIGTEMRKIVSHNVKRIRRNRGLTQKQFAQRTGITHYTVISIEAGKSTSFEVLDAISRTFEISLAELVMKNGAVQESPMSGSEPESVIADRFAALSPFKQSEYRRVGLIIEGIVSDACNTQKASLMNGIMRRVDLIDFESMKGIELKASVVRAVMEGIFEQ
jgi:transcriptional regulator with XRE-family HTH domain